MQVPAPFEYERASSVEAAIGLLDRLDDTARLVAGGHGAASCPSGRRGPGGRGNGEPQVGGGGEADQLVGDLDVGIERAAGAELLDAPGHLASGHPLTVSRRASVQLVMSLVVNRHQARAPIIVA